jgi:hypothetical protein
MAPRHPVPHVLFALLANAAATTTPAWPFLCTTPSSNYSSFNETRCPAYETCAPNPFSLSGWGCAPFVNATICSNFQSCPGPTRCVLSAGTPDPNDFHGVYACVGSGNVSWGRSRCACKPGAPLPPQPNLKNVLIIGDSISIMYTPSVAAALADVAQVQHAPWSSDGGAEESNYALQCGLTHWLASPSGAPISWDLIYFNTGMHNSGQGAAWIVPGQSGEPAAYGAELAALIAGLRGVGTRLLFGITTPMLCNASVNHVIDAGLNPAAAAIMAAQGVQTVDMYSAVIDKCGPVPQASCFDTVSCFCPHCPGNGSDWLATTVIAPAIRNALL